MIRGESIEATRNAGCGEFFISHKFEDMRGCTAERLNAKF